MSSTTAPEITTTGTNEPASPSLPPAPAEPAAPPSSPPPKRRGRKRNPYRQPERAAGPFMQTVAEAAETLRTTEEALRARLRRAQVVGADGSITSPLAPGVVGIKFGANTWRVRFDAK
jgi:hypothetical protein